MAISKNIGKIAEKMIDLTQKATKKLEEYGAQSAIENQNENAKKLEQAMNKLSHAQNGHRHQQFHKAKAFIILHTQRLLSASFLK